jgi:hypothetical protein
MEVAPVSPERAEPAQPPAAPPASGVHATRILEAPAQAPRASEATRVLPAPEIPPPEDDAAKTMLRPSPFATPVRESEAAKTRVIDLDPVLRDPAKSERAPRAPDDSEKTVIRSVPRRDADEQRTLIRPVPQRDAEKTRILPAPKSAEVEATRIIEPEDDDREA